MKPLKIAPLMLSAFVCSTSWGQYSAMNQIDPVGSDLTTATKFSVVQIFPGIPEANSTVIDDFVATGGRVDAASVVFQTPYPDFDPSTIKGWRLSFWASQEDAFNSGTDLSKNAVATQFLTGGLSYTELFGIGGGGHTYRVEAEGLDLNIGIGLRWIGMAPENQVTDGLLYILENKNPANRGGGGIKNCIGANPGGGFGNASKDANYDAAYAVNTVPEPGCAFLVGLAPFIAKHRRRNRSR